ncbi:MAG: FliH/SctL family protein [Balneolaceae bacterium]
MTEISNNGIKINYESLFKRDHESFGTDNEKNHTAEEIYTADQVKKLIEERELHWQKVKEEEVKEEIKKAYQIGFEDGLQKAKKEIGDSTGSILKALKSVDSHVESLMNQVKPHIADMVFDLAEKIIAMPVKSKILNERVTNEIEQIISELERSTKVTVDVAESDLKVVQKRIEDMPDSEHIILRASKELNPGEYRVDTNREQIVKQFRKSLQDFRESIILQDDAESDS